MQLVCWENCFSRHRTARIIKAATHGSLQQKSCWKSKDRCPVKFDDNKMNHPGLVLDILIQSHLSCGYTIVWKSVIPCSKQHEDVASAETAMFDVASVCKIRTVLSHKWSLEIPKELSQVLDVTTPANDLAKQTFVVGNPIELVFTMDSSLWTKWGKAWRVSFFECDAADPGGTANVKTTQFHEFWDFCHAPWKTDEHNHTAAGRKKKKKPFFVSPLLAKLVSKRLFSFAPECSGKTECHKTPSQENWRVEWTIGTEALWLWKQYVCRFPWGSWVTGPTWLCQGKALGSEEPLDDRSANEGFLRLDSPEIFPL